MSIIKKLCKTCSNLTEYVVKDDILFKFCPVCDVMTKCDEDEFVIKSTIYSVSGTNMIINKSISDDPCLPLIYARCDVCNKQQIMKYIRNNDTLKISHLICTVCKSIFEINSQEVH